MESKNTKTDETRLLLRLLNRIERAGNTLPHPTVIFIALCALIILLSALAGSQELSAMHPVHNTLIEAKSLLSQDGVHYILTHTVSNFIQFAPVGTVLVAMLGLGLAEQSGLLAVLLKLTVSKAPERALSFIVVFAGVISSLAADAGYVVLIPLSALLFKSAGRNPLAGIAAAFAGVSGGFSANLMIGPVDAILAGISTEAVQLVQDNYEVSAAGNYYFIVCSTLLIAVIGTWVTERLVEPRLPRNNKKTTAGPLALSMSEQAALKQLGWFSLGFIALLGWGLYPQDGILRNSQTGSILQSPFIKGIVTIIALYMGLAGLIYGKVSRHFNDTKTAVDAMETTMATMAGYLVLMFFAAQFVHYFNWSNLGTLLAVNGANSLKSANVNPATLLVAFVLLSASINLLIGSASAKWALMAPIFVPMLYLVGISPEATQMAYRIGDSSTNIITPLMPYFALVVAFAKQHQRDAGVGTITALMLPYSITLLLAWSCLLALWVALELPLGPGVSTLVEPVLINMNK